MYVCVCVYGHRTAGSTSNRYRFCSWRRLHTFAHPHRCACPNVMRTSSRFIRLRRCCCLHTQLLPRHTIETIEVVRLANTITHNQAWVSMTTPPPIIVHINHSWPRTTAFTKLKYAGHTSDHHQPIKNITTHARVSHGHRQVHTHVRAQTRAATQPHARNTKPPHHALATQLV